MEDKVLKNEDLLKKTEWQRKTYPLKLNLTDVQQVRLDQLFYEYKKATNFIIDIIRNKFHINHIAQLTKDEEEKGICPMCNQERKLVYNLFDFDFVKYGESKGKPHFKPVYKKGNVLKICQGCPTSHYSLRKFLYSTSKRDVPVKDWDFTKGIRLERGVWDSCVQKAIETIKSAYEIKKKIEYKIKWHREKIMENNIELNKELKKPNQDKELIKKLRNFIKGSERIIEKEKKKLAEEVYFNGTAVRLYDSAYSLIKEQDDFYIKLKDFTTNKFLTVEFYGADYQKKLADKFIKSKKAETEIIKRGDNYYLQYIYRQEAEVPIPNESFTAIGIDVNIINLASYLSITKDTLDKPKDINFFSGREMRHKRKRMSKVRQKWAEKTKYKEKGGKGRSRRWFREKCKSQREMLYVKYNIHNITTKIVQDIKDKYDKPVIVLENLKDIRDRIGKEIKITKCSMEKLTLKQSKSIRGEKLLNKDLNNWNFDDFQKMIEYKAKWLGIPVVFVSAKNTSITCNKCGHISQDNYEDYHKVHFKCKKCGYQCNADFNASVNIARQFYKDIEEEKK